MTTPDRSAPMGAAPMRYREDGTVDWGNMWDTFCALPRDGGPAHRPVLLVGNTGADADDPAYQAVVAEIQRGVEAVSELKGAPAPAGWVGLRCPSPAMARWLSEAIVEEGVAACRDGRLLLVPAGPDFTLTGEIKSVVTVVAKTSHYWREHLPREAKEALEAQERISHFWRGLRSRFVGG